MIRYATDERATAEFRAIAERVRRAQERADGSLSRLFAVEVFGLSHEECDALGWGRDA